MTEIKALVVEHEEKTRQIIDEILAMLGHGYDSALCMVEARDRLASAIYSYILLDYQTPARVGGIPRPQNSENFLDAAPMIVGGSVPPVIVIADCLPDLNDEEKYRWAANMRMRGASTFICKPLRTVGRTLDRIIKEILGTMAGTYIPATTAVTGKRAIEIGKTSKQWLSVSDAAELLSHDLPGLGLKKARSRVSTAAGRGEFQYEGDRRDRLIEPHTFSTWRLRQRDRDLKAEDEA